jgi:hypothetical protein
MSAEMNSNNQSANTTKLNSDQLSSLTSLGNNVALTVTNPVSTNISNSNNPTSNNLMSTMMSPNNMKKISKISKI